MQQPHKTVGCRRCVLTRPELTTEPIEGLRLGLVFGDGSGHALELGLGSGVPDETTAGLWSVCEIVQVEYGLWIGQVVLLDIVVQPRSWGPTRQHTGLHSNDRKSQTCLLSCMHLKSGMPALVDTPAPSMT